MCTSFLIVVRFMMQWPTNSVDVSPQLHTICTGATTLAKVSPKLRKTCTGATTLTIGVVSCYSECAVVMSTDIEYEYYVTLFVSKLNNKSVRGWLAITATNRVVYGHMNTYKHGYNYWHIWRFANRVLMLMTYGTVGEFQSSVILKCRPYVFCATFPYMRT